MNAFNVVRTPPRPFGCEKEVIVETCGGYERRKGVEFPSDARGRSDDTQLVHQNSSAFYPAERPYNRGCQVTDVALAIVQLLLPPNLLKLLQCLSCPWRIDTRFKDGTFTLGGNGVTGQAENALS